MFDNLTLSLSSINAEDRAKLAELLTGRNEYLTHVITLNALRTEYLLNPTEENEAKISAFSSTVVAPLRDGLRDPMLALMTSAIDVEKIKGMLPMFVAVLMQSVNVPLLLTTVGLDVDQVQKFTEIIKDFITPE